LSLIIISNNSKPISYSGTTNMWKNLLFVFVNVIWGVLLVAPAAKKTTMMNTNVNVVKCVYPDNIPSAV